MENVHSLDMTILAKFTDLAMCFSFSENRGTGQDFLRFGKSCKKGVHEIDVHHFNYSRRLDRL
jgi:hypothetical protein